ncbi:hypothetical protein NA2_20562 [Nitratireductor pacificus pht-3B]|uniref:Lipoprotein n=1 Tax=Nitratireductor pacificus pht-3B TaxID=391937 RepID=K2LGM7_9HYPH|nr:hypothetical protein NA2_20562 [Nitratireductor pacificus pht-3B]
MKQVPLRARLVIVCAVALSVAGCQTSEPGSATGSIRQIIGTDIIGAHGETIADQNRIDLTVEGPCAARVFSAAECIEHRRSSVRRRAELRAE